jgi:hypothetical protein
MSIISERLILVPVGDIHLEDTWRKLFLGTMYVFDFLIALLRLNAPKS